MVKLYAPSTNAVTQGWGAEFYSMNSVDYPGGVYRTLYGWPGHNGIDFSYGPDRNVYAAAAGTVAFADWGEKQAGKWFPAGGIVTMIDHGDCYTVYAHQYENDKVKVGQKVKAGQIIGTIGATGMTAGAHLHFEVFPKSPNFSNGWAGRIKPVLASSKPYTAAPAASTIKPTKPAAREDDDMPFNIYNQCTKKQALPVGKWKTLDINNKGHVSHLSGAQARRTINYATVTTPDLPKGAEIHLRWIVVDYQKGKTTKIYRAHEYEDFVGTSGYSKFKLITPSNIPANGRYRLRLQAVTYSENVSIAKVHIDSYCWK